MLNSSKCQSDAAGLNRYTAYIVRMIHPKKIAVGVITTIIILSAVLLLGHFRSVEYADSRVEPVKEMLPVRSVDILFFRLLPNLERRILSWRVSYRDPNILGVVDPSFYFSFSGEFLCTEPSKLIEYIKEISDKNSSSEYTSTE